MELDSRPVQLDPELQQSIRVIREAFATVVKEFGLTIDSAPTNPAFIEYKHLQKMRDNRIPMFGFYHEQQQIGFAAIEAKLPETFFLERLAVMPQYRHKGVGRQIIKHMEAYVRGLGGKIIRIGVMDNNIVLKAWYQQQGFIEQQITEFPHLPFAVCYMEKKL